MFKLRSILFVLVVVFVSSFISSDASAVSRLSACTFGSSGGTNMASDGSNCDAGLACDPTVKICVNLSETACSNLYPCSIGSRCIGASGQLITSSNTGNGICAFNTGSAENNAFGDVFCNSYAFITGKVGRGVFLVAVVVIGVTFFMGKVQFTTLVITGCGCGLVFGAPAIVSVFVGKGFAC